MQVDFKMQSLSLFKLDNLMFVYKYKNDDGAVRRLGHIHNQLRVLTCFDSIRYLFGFIKFSIDNRF